MTDKKTFDGFVASQTIQTKESEIDWDKHRDEWLSKLEEFYILVENFLHEYIEKQQIQLVYNSKKIIEEHIGSYDAKTAYIVIGRNKIYLEPIGTNLIAAKGRVDMNGPSGKVKFVLVDKDASAPNAFVHIWIEGEEPPSEQPRKDIVEWAWKIGTPPPRIRYIELTQESFFDALMEVANG